MDVFVNNNSAWISFWGLVVTSVGFILTIWQLFIVNGKVKKVEEATKLRIKNTLNLVSVVEMIYLITSIQDKLQAKDWDRSIDKLSRLHTDISEIVTDPVVKDNVRHDFEYCVSQITSDLAILREYEQETPNTSQLRNMKKNLDLLLENLKLVEQKLK